MFKNCVHDCRSIYFQLPEDLVAWPVPTTKGLQAETNPSEELRAD